MSWSVETTPRFDREFKKLDRFTQRMLKSWVVKNLQGTMDPHLHGRALTGNMRGLWRYRIGDYRLICRLEGDRRAGRAVVLIPIEEAKGRSAASRRWRESASIALAAVTICTDTKLQACLASQ